MSEHHVIYVPGLGDNKARGQKLVVKFWRIFGVYGHYVPMQWAQGKTFEPKMQRLLDKIDELSKDDDSVSLIGTSAGASAVLLAYAQRKDKISGVVCVCGKVNNPDDVNPRLYRENPAFKLALAELQEALPMLPPTERYRIMSIHPLRDETVPPADTIIRGALEKTIWTRGHSFSIAIAITLGAPMIMRFLKRQSIVLHTKAEDLVL